METIHDLKLTKPTAAGKARWRFSVATDIQGWTVLTVGWLYLPHAKAGYRVNPARIGYWRPCKGVGLDLCRVLEKAVERKLELRAGVESEVVDRPEDDEFYIPAPGEGEPTWG